MEKNKTLFFLQGGNTQLFAKTIKKGTPNVYVFNASTMLPEVDRQKIAELLRGQQISEEQVSEKEKNAIERNIVAILNMGEVDTIIIEISSIPADIHKVWIARGKSWETTMHNLNIVTENFDETNLSQRVIFYLDGENVEHLGELLVKGTENSKIISSKTLGIKTEVENNGEPEESSLNKVLKRAARIKMDNLFISALVNKTELIVIEKAMLTHQTDLPDEDNYGIYKRFGEGEAANITIELLTVNTVAENGKPPKKKFSLFGR